MASIIHVTDKDMIEFHRINGNKKMNFWRPGSNKRFADFKAGDYLFFLAKGSERKKEKGIIGYGKCVNMTSCHFDYMWRKYGQLNGYHTKKDCYEAIMKVSKDKEMPKRLNCIELENVVFFQAPVYLSEFGVKISNKLESYTYIDKEKPFLSSMILNKASKIGIDLWTTNRSEAENKRVLAINAVRLACGNIYTLLKAEESVHMRILMEEYMKAHSKCEWIIGSKKDAIEIDNDQITIDIPVLLNSDEDYKSLQEAIGHAIMFKGLLNQIHIDEFNDFNLKLIINQRINNEMLQLLELYKISVA